MDDVAKVVMMASSSAFWVMPLCKATLVPLQEAPGFDTDSASGDANLARPVRDPQPRIRPSRRAHTKDAMVRVHPITSVSPDVVQR